MALEYFATATITSRIVNSYARSASTIAEERAEMRMDHDMAGIGKSQSRVHEYGM